MDDERFAAGIAILQYLSKAQTSTTPSLYFTAVKLFISFQNLDDSSHYLFSLLACYHLSTKLFENQVTLIGIRKKLSAGPFTKDFKNNFSKLGIIDLENQFNTTYVSRSIERCELSIIAALGFKFKKINLEIDIINYIKLTLSWFIPNNSYKDSKYHDINNFSKYIHHILSQVVFLPGIYFYDTKLVSISLARLVLEHFMAPLDIFG